MATQHINIKNKVLACVDQSKFAEYVCDYAVWAAGRIHAPLEFLHVIDRHPETALDADHSGAIGVDAQDHLLSELSERDASRSKAARETGRLFLNGLRERAIDAGIAAPDIRQRHGELESTLIEAESGVRLFVLGRRGASTQTDPRDLGRNVERVVRALKQPLLTVTENFREPQKIMLAFDGGIVTRRGVEMVAESPLFKGLPVHLLMSGKERSDSKKQLDWAQKTLETAGFDAPTLHITGDAGQVIGSQVQALNIDLLIMGAYAHTPLRSLFLGSKTNHILRASTVPTLLLR